MVESLWLRCLTLFFLASLSGASTGFKNPSFVANSLQESKLPDSLDKPAQTESAATNLTLPSATVPEWKRVLPSPLNNKTNTLQRLIIPGPEERCVEVYLLGTAHVSTDSSRDVKVLLECVKPGFLFLELCDQRLPMLVTPKPTSARNNNPIDPETKTKKPGFLRRLRTRSPEEKSMYGMAASLLTSMQQDYADSLGVELGGEFRIAYDYWEEHRTSQRLHMILGDRPLYLTLTRAWESLGIWGKTRLILGLLISSLHKPSPKELQEWMQSILQDDTGDLLSESIAELAQHFPTLERVIIQERDAYMACKLYQTCRSLLLSDKHTPRHTLVAVVGAGHVEGMRRWLLGENGTESPEAVLDKLIKIKKAIPEEDRRVLVHDVLEVNYHMLQELANSSA